MRFTNHDDDTKLCINNILNILRKIVNNKACARDKDANEGYNLSPHATLVSLMRKFQLWIQHK